jgi:hypothetical protein
MKSAFWRVIALAMIAVLVPSMAFAGGEVARSAMSGTNFMNTSADTWVLFHRAMDGEGFGEFVSQGYAGEQNKGATFNEGYGRLIMPVGDYRIGISVNDRATGSSVADYTANGGPYNRVLTIGDWVADNGFTGFNGFLNGEFVNAKIAGSLAEGGWSGGVGWYSNGFDDNEADVKDNATGLTVNGSWGNGAPGVQGTIEVAAEFTLHSDKHEETGADAELSGNHIAADARYSLNDNSHFGAGFVMLSSDLEAAGGTDTAGFTSFRIVYVRDLVEEESRGANAEVGFGWSNFSFEPDGASEQTESSLDFPSCRFAGWNRLSEHFKLFGGVSNSWGTSTEEDSDNAIDLSSRGDSFGWTAGLGWDPTDNVAIEIFVLTDNISSFATLGSTTPIVGGIGAHAGW